MRVNIYAEEMTQRVEVIQKNGFTGLRFYLELPVTTYPETGIVGETVQVKGPFMHHPGDDDSSAVTFWGKQDLRRLLVKALDELDDYYDARKREILGDIPVDPLYPYATGG